jgi:hypothetical protein
MRVSWLGTVYQKDTPGQCKCNMEREKVTLELLCE